MRWSIHHSGKGRSIPGEQQSQGSGWRISKAYAGVPGLLQKVINENDTAAWTEITNRIDYIYANLDSSLAGLDKETGFAGEVQAQVRSGKKLLFKPNLVGPTGHRLGDSWRGFGCADLYRMAVDRRFDEVVPRQAVT